MTDERTIRPAAGRRVRHPATRRVLEHAAVVPWSSYWERLLGAGDIEIVAPPGARTPRSGQDARAPETPVKDA